MKFYFLIVIQHMFCLSDAHWASMNLGIVLCLKCAGKFRLGKDQFSLKDRGK